MTQIDKLFPGVLTPGKTVSDLTAEDMEDMSCIIKAVDGYADDLRRHNNDLRRTMDETDGILTRRQWRGIMALDELTGLMDYLVCFPVLLDEWRFTWRWKRCKMRTAHSIRSREREIKTLTATNAKRKELYAAALETSTATTITPDTDRMSNTNDTEPAPAT